MDEIDLTRSTERAWLEFREALVERVEGMDDGEAVRMSGLAGRESDAGTPLVEVRVCEDRVVAELSGVADGPWRLDKGGRLAIKDLGWRKVPGDGGCYRLAVERRYVDRIAHVVVAALRDVFGALHPALLEGDVAVPEDPDLPRLAVPEEPELPVAAYVRDREHLCSLVDATLATVFGHPPKYDEDGDIPVLDGTSVVFVRVLGDRPAVRLFADLVVGVQDFERAADEVARLNAAHVGVSFRVDDDRIRCAMDVDGVPFAPDHLRTALRRMCEVASRNDRGLARRVLGRTFNPAGQWRGSVAPEVAVLLEDERAVFEVVKPRQLVEMCSGNSEVLLTLLRRAHKDRETWSRRLAKARTSGDDAWLETCESRVATAQRRYKRIGKALRLALEQ